MNWVSRAVAGVAARLPPRVRAWTYRLGPLTRALRSLLNRSVPQGRTEVEVAAGLLRGARFELNLQQEKDMWLGTYEVDLLSHLPHIVRAGMTVYDVGANIGYLTVALARLVGPEGRVYAFEPLPDNLQRLRHGLQQNDLAGVVTVVEAAVGEQAGTSSFLVHRSVGMGKLAGSGGRADAYEASIDVEVVTLDRWAESKEAPAPDLIKIDVEGGEGAVLAGAQRLLARDRPDLILELHGPEAAAAAWRVLESECYRVHRVGPTMEAVPSLSELHWKDYVLARHQDRPWPGTDER